MGRPVVPNLSVTATLASQNIQFVLTVTTGCNKSRGRFEIDFYLRDKDGRERKATYRGDWAEAARQRFEIVGSFQVGDAASLMQSEARNLWAECD